jgi:hypothetical protein
MSKATKSSRVDLEPKGRLTTSFNGSVKIEGQASQLTADVGVIALREIDEKLSLTADLARSLDDLRRPDLITHETEDLLRERVFLMAAGHSRQDDVDRLRDDPAVSLACSSHRGVAPLRADGAGLSSQPSQSRLTARLSSRPNNDTLQESLIKWAGKTARLSASRKVTGVTLDFDSTPIRVHGQQIGSSYNGHRKARCFNPLVAQLRETGDWVAAKLRMGHEHCKVGALEMLQTIIPQIRKEIAPVRLVCGDAAFPDKEILDWLEQEDLPYVFRLQNSAVLDRIAEPLLKRPPGRRPARERRWAVDREYGAVAWKRTRRIVIVIIDRPGELFLKHHVLVTNMSPSQMDGIRLADEYGQRATMEAHIGELKNALSLQLSCTNRKKSHVRGRKPVTRSEPGDAALANQATFLLYAHAYNLANAVRRVLSRHIEQKQKKGLKWSIKRLQDVFLRRPARILVSARNVVVSTGPEEFALLQIIWRALARLQVLSNPKLE